MGEDRLKLKPLNASANLTSQNRSDCGGPS
jgi:hypothetical protein